MRRWKAHRGKVAALSFSRDGRFLASVTGSGKDVFIWDATAGELVRKLTPAELEGSPGPDRFNAASVAFAPDADLLAVGRKSWVELISTTTWKVHADFFTGHDSSGTGTAYELAVGSGTDPLVASGHTAEINIWSVAGRELRRINAWNASGNAQIAFSHDVRYCPDGSRIAFASTKTIESHPASLDDPEDVIRYVGHKNKVWVLRYTPDGRSLISASSDGTARVWDADTGAQKRCFEFDVGKMLAADVSPDGTVAAVGGATGEIIVWDLD